jgi:hypothetical protein
VPALTAVSMNPVPTMRLSVWTGKLVVLPGMNGLYGRGRNEKDETADE